MPLQISSTVNNTGNQSCRLGADMGARTAVAVYDFRKTSGTQMHSRP